MNNTNIISFSVNPTKIGKEKIKRNFTLNTIQAYAIYYIITNTTNNFTPFQSGLNMKIVESIENALRANMSYRNNNNNLLVQ